VNFVKISTSDKERQVFLLKNKERTQDKAGFAAKPKALD
jgi:hypothetical protein